MPRLGVELVPRTAWWSNVRSNVSRAEWETCKRFVRDRSGSRCEVCGGRGSRYPVDCHEIWGYDDDRAIQTLVDLTALCPACHEVKHIGRAFAIGNGPRALAHLATVNDWDLPKAERYLKAVFDLWQLRSQVSWSLNIDFLASIGVVVPERIERETSRKA